MSRIQATDQTPQPSVRVSSHDEVERPESPAPVPAQLVEETGYLLRRAYVLAGEWAATAMPDGVPIRHYEVLQALADLGPRSQQQLAELLRVNRTIMVKLIDALESAGLVKRVRNPSDRRSYALELTPDGGRERARLATAADRAEAGLTAPLTRREHATLRALLSTVALDGESGALPVGLAARTGFLVTLAHGRVREQVEQRLGALGLTTSLYGPLATIATRGPISQQAIAEQLGFTGPAIVQTVDRLQAAGLVERHRDPTDRRAYALELTNHGQDMLHQARTAIAQTMKHLDQLLGAPERRSELNRLLRNLLESN